MTEVGTRREVGDREWSQAEELLELAPVAFVVTDARGMIREANAAAAALFGVEHRFLRLQKPLALFLENPRAARRFMVGVLERDRMDPVEGEFVIVPRSRRRAHAAVTARAFRNERGEPSVLWAFLDIEARVAAETELRLLAEELEGRVAERAAELEGERARLEAILDGLPAAVIVASALSGRIVVVNDQAEEMLGRPIAPGEMADMTAGFDEAGTRLESDEWPLARALRRGESVRGERIRVAREDGSSLTIEANAQPIHDAQGQVIAAVVVFWDVSERERRERAEREFITNAAHELQTPVASIVSAVEVLSGGAKDDPEHRDRFLAHLDRESARLVRVLRALLVIARTQLGHESVDVAPVEVRPLLDGIVLGLHPQRGIEVVVRCPARLTVTSNEELLEQAIGNLASNSARHTQKGRIVISAARGPEGVRIDVSDTGPGIDEADAERLFERFMRGDRRDRDGFGLGLSIARQAVTALGGTVTLESRRGGGTVARVVLPETGTEES